MPARDHSRLVQGKCSRGAGARPNYAKRLLKECSSVVQSDVELAKLMQDRVEESSGINAFVFLSEKIIINWAPRFTSRDPLLLYVPVLP